MKHEGAVFCLGIETGRRSFDTHEELETWLKETVEGFEDLAVQVPTAIRVCKCPVPVSAEAKAFFATIERSVRVVDTWPAFKRRDGDTTIRFTYTDAELADYLESLGSFEVPFRADIMQQIITALRRSP